MSIPRSVYRAILSNLDKLAHGKNPVITAAVLEARDDASLRTLPDLLERIRLYQEAARDLESYAYIVADFDEVDLWQDLFEYIDAPFGPLRAYGPVPETTKALYRSKATKSPATESPSTAEPEIADPSSVSESAPATSEEALVQSSNEPDEDDSDSGESYFDAAGLTESGELCDGGSLADTAVYEDDAFCEESSLPDGLWTTTLIKEEAHVSAEQYDNSLDNSASPVTFATPSLKRSAGSSGDANGENELIASAQMLADRTIAPLPTRAATATLVVATDASMADTGKSEEGPDIDARPLKRSRLHLIQRIDWRKHALQMAAAAFTAGAIFGAYQLASSYVFHPAVFEKPAIALTRYVPFIGPRQECGGSPVSAVLTATLKASQAAYDIALHSSIHELNRQRAAAAASSSPNAMFTPEAIKQIERAVGGVRQAAQSIYVASCKPEQGLPDIALRECYARAAEMLVEALDHVWDEAPGAAWSLKGDALAAVAKVARDV